MQQEAQYTLPRQRSKAIANQEQRVERLGASEQSVSPFVHTHASGLSVPKSNAAIQRAVPIHASVLQRVPTPTPTTTDHRSNHQISRMTAKEFDDYAQKQADWFASDKLTDTYRDKLRMILTFIRKGYVGACGGLHVWRMLAMMRQFGDSDYLTQLEHYAQAVADNKPINLSPTTSSLKSYRIGKALGKLKMAFPEWVLRTALNEYELDWLRRDGLIDDVAQYATTSSPKPVFQAQDGSDFSSYYDARKVDNDNPLRYHSGALGGKIRNFHRFTRKALRRLETNFGASNNTKPVTLILHTSLDHNGAFHRDPNLDAVIRDNSMLTLMLEGFEDLASMQAQIQPLAKQYSQNDKIDQVMIAGHGNAGSMQLTGKIEENVDKHTIKEDGEGLKAPRDLSSHPLWPTMSEEKRTEAQERKDKASAATTAFFEEILNNMDMNPANPGHRRILLNACLTGSNAVWQALDTKDVSKAQKEIKDFIQKNPSLMNMVQGQADAKATGAVNVLGANASFGSEAKLIDPLTHELDLKSAEDPKLTASKLEYVEHGTEPTGALRAVLECWANDRASCFDAMTRKIASVSSSDEWDQVIIRTCYKIILDKYKDNADKIRLVGKHGGDLGHIHPWLNINRRNFKGFDAFGADAITMLTAVQSSDKWTGDKKVPLSLLHAWMSLDVSNASLKTQFLTLLDASFTVRSAREIVDIDYLDSKGHLSLLLGGAASNAKLKLALLGVVGSKVNSACKTYLQGQVDTATKHFPAALNVSAALGGASDENKVLTKIGFGTASTPSNPKANVRLEGESQNTIHVKPMTERRIVLGALDSTVPVFTRPDGSSTKAGDKAIASEIQIVGKIGKWLAIEFQYSSPDHWGTAFIREANTL